MRTGYLTVVGWKLVQQLLDPVSLPKAVHVRHSVLRQAAEVLVHLSGRREEEQTQPRVTAASAFVATVERNQVQNTNLLDLSRFPRFLLLILLPTFVRFTATCSGLRPGGTQEYSSEAQPESSSEMECRWKSDTSLVIIFSNCPGTERTACSSRTHLQCTQIFLPRRETVTTEWVPRNSSGGRLL